MRAERPDFRPSPRRYSIVKPCSVRGRPDFCRFLDAGNNETLRMLRSSRR
jgi:hypothetical protein